MMKSRTTPIFCIIGCFILNVILPRCTDVVLVAAQASGNPPCYFCEGDATATLSNPTGVVPIPSDLAGGSGLTEISCSNLLAAGKAGYISADSCGTATTNDELKSFCGCSNYVAAPMATPMAAPRATPVAAPVVSPTTPVPVTVPPPVDVPVDATPGLTKAPKEGNGTKAPKEEKGTKAPTEEKGRKAPDEGTKAPKVEKGTKASKEENGVVAPKESKGTKTSKGEKGVIEPKINAPKGEKVSKGPKTNTNKEPKTIAVLPSPSSLSGIEVTSLSPVPSPPLNRNLRAVN
jgi:hypothetical protein